MHDWLIKFKRASEKHSSEQVLLFSLRSKPFLYRCNSMIKNYVQVKVSVIKRMVKSSDVDKLCLNLGCMSILKYFSYTYFIICPAIVRYASYN